MVELLLTFGCLEYMFYPKNAVTYFLSFTAVFLMQFKNKVAIA